MNPYVGIALLWVAAAYCFSNSYYGIRYPERYIRANWTVMRGLPKVRDSASTGAAISMLAGVFLFGLGLMVLHSLLTQSNSSLSHLP